MMQNVRKSSNKNLIVNLFAGLFLIYIYIVMFANVNLVCGRNFQLVNRYNKATTCSLQVKNRYLKLIDSTTVFITESQTNGFG